MYHSNDVAKSLLNIFDKSKKLYIILGNDQLTFIAGCKPPSRAYKRILSLQQYLLENDITIIDLGSMAGKKIEKRGPVSFEEAYNLAAIDNRKLMDEADTDIVGITERQIDRLETQAENLETQAYNESQITDLKKKKQPVV